jgi:dolichol-phosphate mannosyltransferase
MFYRIYGCAKRSAVELISQELEYAIASQERAGNTLVFAPTYNEAATVKKLIDGILDNAPACDALIVDDASDDGTSEIVAERARTDARVRLILRSGKLGIGSAHKLAWHYARKLGYSRIVTLDADLSHDPSDIPRLLNALDAGADVAIGSRFARGGSLDYSGWRRFQSIIANSLARLLLWLPLTEYTTSLRAAVVARVPTGVIESIRTDSYGFFLTSAVRFVRLGLNVVEIPIHFRDRNQGRSKMPRLEILRGVANLFLLAVDRRSINHRFEQAAGESISTSCDQLQSSVRGAGDAHEVGARDDERQLETKRL